MKKENQFTKLKLEEKSQLPTLYKRNAGYSAKFKLNEY